MRFILGMKGITISTDLRRKKHMIISQNQKRCLTKLDHLWFKKSQQNMNKRKDSHLDKGYTKRKSI